MIDVLTTLDDPEDIVDELLNKARAKEEAEADCQYVLDLPDQKNIYRRAAEEIQTLRRVLGMTSN